MIDLVAKVYGVELIPLGKMIFYSDNGEDLKKGDLVLVYTDMGQEVGKVVLGPKNKKFEEIGYEIKPIIRKLTDEDLKIHEENLKMAKEAVEKTKKYAQELGLKIRILKANFVFDRSRLIIYFGADTRVDFRELVKKLAKDYKTRIEMRQIGIRDEVKMVGSLGLCGRITCCSLFLREFSSIKMEMAKTQQMLINTAKISGRCGRLLCCLRYEHDFYEEIMEGLPYENTTIEYEGKPAKVITVNAFLQMVTLQIIEENQPVIVKVPFSYFKEKRRKSIQEE